MTSADFNTRIRMQVAADEDDLSMHPRQSFTRGSGVRIEFTDDSVIVHGLGLYPMPIERERVGRLEAWIE